MDLYIQIIITQDGNFIAKNHIELNKTRNIHKLSHGANLIHTLKTDFLCAFGQQINNAYYKNISLRTIILGLLSLVMEKLRRVIYGFDITRKHMKITDPIDQTDIH